VSTVVNTSHPDPGSVPVRDAATVMLLRDSELGLEVCMLQRNLDSDFVGGAYVFPGGGVDPEDAAEEMCAVCQGRTDEQASLLVGSERGGLAFWVAAIRESFEEAGVLLARTAEGEVVSFERPEVADRFAQHRAAVDSGRRSLVDVCRVERLRLDVGSIHYFSRWVTPLGAPRRYDTRFFVAAAPPGQVALHDDREVIGTRWINPRDALADHAAGRMTMIFPTVRTMVALERFERAAEVIEHAAGQARVNPVVPMLRDEGGGLRLILPGDPERTGGVYDPMTGEPLDGDGAGGR
jgi:8-oxo-dGTP pyrophosphatase MutT (NUDIX family)